MKCPECSKSVMTYWQFLGKIYPRRLRCEHCGAELIWTAKWRGVFGYSLVFAGIAAFMLGMLRRMLGIGRLEFLIVFVVAALIFAAVYWHEAEYVKAT